MKCDVVVVGGGPGGSMAAKTAAEKGLKVLLIEKRNKVGYPVRCGEGVAYSICGEFGISPKEYFNKVDFFDIISPAGRTIRRNAPSYVVNRQLFDRDLVEEAEAKGAEVWLNTRAVKLHQKNGIFSIETEKDGRITKAEPKIIIAADGVESVVGRLAGIDTSLKLKEIGSAAAAVIEGINIERNVMKEYFLKEVPLGYFWIFPKSENTANVGVGMIRAHGLKTTPIDMLNSFLKNTEALRGGKIKYYTSGGVPATLRMEKLYFRNILFVGDAARLSNPMAGDGVPQAILSGKLAGEISAKSISLDKLEILEEYENEWERTKLNKRNVQDVQYALYIIQEALLKLPQHSREIVLEELWSIALSKNQYPFILTNAIKTGLKSEIFKIVIKDERIRTWAIRRFFSLVGRKIWTSS